MNRQDHLSATCWISKPAVCMVNINVLFPRNSRSREKISNRRSFSTWMSRIQAAVDIAPRSAAGFSDALGSSNSSRNPTHGEDVHALIVPSDIP